MKPPTLTAVEMWAAVQALGGEAATDEKWTAIYRAARNKLLIAVALQAPRP